MGSTLAGWAVPVWILGAPFVMLIIETIRARGSDGR